MGTLLGRDTSADTGAVLDDSYMTWTMLRPEENGGEECIATAMPLYHHCRL